MTWMCDTRRPRKTRKATAKPIAYRQALTHGTRRALAQERIAKDKEGPFRRRHVHGHQRQLASKFPEQPGNKHFYAMLRDDEPTTSLANNKCRHDRARMAVTVDVILLASCSMSEPSAKNRMLRSRKHLPTLFWDKPPLSASRCGQP